MSTELLWMRLAGGLIDNVIEMTLVLGDRDGRSVRLMYEIKVVLAVHRGNDCITIDAKLPHDRHSFHS